MLTKKALLPLLFVTSSCLGQSASPLLPSSSLPSAKQYFDNAMIEMDKNSFLRAIQAFDMAIQSDPGFADAWYYRAKAKVGIDNYEGALLDYNKVIQLQPQKAEAWLYRGFCKDKLKKDPMEGILDYNKAIKINPGLAQAYYDRALSYYLLGDYSKALLDYNQAIEPEWADAYEFRGQIYETIGDQAKANTDYDKATTLRNTRTP